MLENENQFFENHLDTFDGVDRIFISMSQKYVNLYINTLPIRSLI